MGRAGHGELNSRGLTYGTLFNITTCNCSKTFLDVFIIRDPTDRSGCLWHLSVRGAGGRGASASIFFYFYP